MSKNQVDLPFTELVERAAQIARLEGADSRVRGAVNDVYVLELPRKEDWSYQLVTSSLTCTAEFKTGTASADTQGNIFTLSSDALVDATFVGRRIKFSSNPNVYEITSINSTTGGILHAPLSGSQNVRTAAYSIFQPIYALGSDFDRFPKNGGILRYEGGAIRPLEEEAIQNYFDNYSGTPGTPEKCRLVSVGTDGVQRVELRPPPKDQLVLGVEYMRELVPLRETTAGFVDVSAGATTVTGSVGTTKFTEAGTGWYFRIDAFGTGADSEWYQVVGVTHNSSLTLATAFGLSGATTSGYTLSAVPQIPSKVQPAILYGAVVNLLADQSDPMVTLYQQKLQETVTEARRLYRTRNYRQPIDSVLEDVDYRR